MKLNSILAGVAAFAATLTVASADPVYYVTTTNTFSLSGTYSYDALTTNDTINNVTNYSVSASTVNHGGNLLGKKSTSVTSYTTNYNEITVLSSASFALKDYLAAINTDLTNNPALSNVLASASLTNLPAATKLQVITSVDEYGNNFNMDIYLVIPVGRTNISYSLYDANMFSYSTQGQYVYSRNLNDVLTSSGSSFSGSLTGIEPLSFYLYSTPNCMPHVELDLYAIGTGTLNFSGTNAASVSATTTLSLNPLAGNIYVRDAHFQKVTGVFVGTSSGSGTGSANIP